MSSRKIPGFRKDFLPDRGFHASTSARVGTETDAPGRVTLIAAALAKGESRLFPIARSEDMLATMDCLRELGADFTVENDAVTVRSSGNLHHRGGVLNCRESGSTLRFLLPP